MMLNLNLAAEMDNVSVNSETTLPTLVKKLEPKQKAKIKQKQKQKREPKREQPQHRRKMNKMTACNVRF